MTLPQTTAWLDQEDAHLVQTLRRHRFAVQYVGPGTSPDEPPFSYTVGLFGLGHPELLVTGLHPVTAHALLNWAAPQIIDHDRDFLPGERCIVDRGPGQVYVEMCPNPGEILYAANRFYRRPPEVSVPAYQLAWTDAAGRFPFESGYDGGNQPRPGTWTA